MSVSAPFYRTPAEAMNNQRFMADVPFSYQPSMPQAMRSGRTKNLVNYADSGNRQNMRVTVAQMLDMFENGHEFRIIHPEDVYVVFRLIDRWIGEATSHIAARSMPHIVFAKRLVAFRQDSFVNFQLAVLKIDGLMNEIISIYGNNTTFDKVFSQGGAATETAMDRMTKENHVKVLLRQLRNPPIDETLLEIKPTVAKNTAGSTLDELLPADTLEIDEGFVNRLYGKG